MHITAVETIVPDVPLNRAFVFVRIHTDDGLVGLGQTADLRTIDVIHDLGRGFLLGADPLRISALWHRMFDAVAYHGYAGAETRAISAFDIALWDIYGQSVGQPIGGLLGGRMRDSVAVYNTCGAFRGRSDARRAVKDPVGLAHELLAEGITCMKWSVFDRYAIASDGQSISTSEIAEGIRGIEMIADSLGGRMDVMIEGHGRWTPGCALQIVRALDGLPVRWFEDPITQDIPEEWARLRAKSPVPLAGGERLQTRHQLRRLVDGGGVDVVISDVTWTGGISEMQRTASFAEMHGIPVASHDNSGPVNLWASAHVLTSVPNAYAAETVRLYHDPVDGYYHELVEGPEIYADGRLAAPSAPGLGIRLRNDVKAISIRTTSLDGAPSGN